MLQYYRLTAEIIDPHGTYPFHIRSQVIARRHSPGSCLLVMHRRLARPARKKERLLRFTLTAVPLFSRTRGLLPVNFFDEAGRHIGTAGDPDTPFAGRNKEENRFRPGELVAVIFTGHLHAGIVAALPPTPEETAAYYKRVMRRTGFSSIDELTERGFGRTTGDDVYRVLVGTGGHIHPGELAMLAPPVPIPPEEADVLFERFEAEQLERKLSFVSRSDDIETVERRVEALGARNNLYRFLSHMLRWTWHERFSDARIEELTEILRELEIEAARTDAEDVPMERWFLCRTVAADVHRRARETGREATMRTVESWIEILARLCPEDVRFRSIFEPEEKR